MRDNIGAGLSLAKLPNDQIKAKVEAAAAALKLTDYLDRKPKALSGGQRVAIGRAIVRDPKVFLLDEPLSDLDALHPQMRIELSDIHRKLGATMIYVTHDQVEAMTMADKIGVLNGGKIVQVGSPIELYNAPVSPFVAGFIESPKTKLYPGDAAGERCGTYGIRPEHLRHPALDRDRAACRKVGADTVIYLDVPGLGEMIVRTDGDANPAIGLSKGVSPVEGRDFRYA